MVEFKAKSAAEMRKLAEAATQHDYGGWKYRGPSDCLQSGWVTGSEGSPVLATVQWPVPTMDHALLGHDASKPVGELIAACSPSQIIHDANLIDSLTKEVEGLKEALEWIADAADPDAGENYRADDREGCLDFVHATARTALSTSGRAP